MGGAELSDCRAFYDFINCKAGRIIHEWHQERPRLQRTWKCLMLLLMAFLGRPIDNESLKTYQRDRWGSLNGETCVIELSGLPANSFSVPRDRGLFRQERITAICERLRTYKPALLVIYGVRTKYLWEAGGGYSPDALSQVQSTILEFTPHPSRPTRPDSYWIGRGERLRARTA